MGSLLITSGGFFSTVQDLGRYNQQINGFPISGPMDVKAHKIANLLVGNPVNAATIEMAFMGIKAEFNVHTFCAISGSSFQAFLNKKLIKTNHAYQIKPGDEIEISRSSSGRYCYLSVAGGIQTSPVLGSRSTTTKIKLGGYKGRQLLSGDRLPIEERYQLPAYFHRHVDYVSSTDNLIRVLKGPQFDWFSKQLLNKFFNSEYKITNNSDRMGYRLDGPRLKANFPSLLSEATVNGSIQISSDGSPIVLLADRQTTGGYPVIATVIDSDIGKFVQKEANQKIRFKLITLDEAISVNKHNLSKIDEISKLFRNKTLVKPYGITRIASQRIEEIFR